MDKNKSTHFIFDGTKIIISPNLLPIISFLQEIEKEIESLLGREKINDEIKAQFLETWQLVETLSNQLKENSLEFSFQLSEAPETIADKLMVHRPTRSEMIILFAYIETLNCMHVAYHDQISYEDHALIISKAKENLITFLDDYCLNSKNQWIKNNSERAKKLNAKNIRKLRNYLTHFFSSAKEGPQISHDLLSAKSRKLEARVGKNLLFISPEDLYEIIKNASMLMIKEWNDECLGSLNTEDKNFENKIQAVNSLIKNLGAKIIYNNEIII